MGKVNRKVQELYRNNPRHQNRGIVRRSHNLVASKKPGPSKLQAPPTPAKAVLRPRLPFNGTDRVLCVGEGDFSFALSLATYHKVKYIVATCYDDEETLHQKYPQSQQTILQLLSGDASEEKLSLEEEEEEEEGEGEEAEWKGLSPSPSHPSAKVPPISSLITAPRARGFPKNTPTTLCKSVHYALNATKLSTTHAKLLNTHSPFTKIVFNFPHVGGLSTDVNRQVRANQELLVGFFKSVLPLLASPKRPVQIERLYGEDGVDDDLDALSDEDDVSQRASEKNSRSIFTKGQILVTLFEGEPYTLWNIRDLARHSGLKVVESFRFPWEAYPGYAHARTVGEITRGKDRSVEGKRKGAWRGEEREARCYVLEAKEEETNVSSRLVLGTGANSAELETRKRKGKRRRMGTTGGSDSESGSE